MRIGGVTIKIYIRGFAEEKKEIERKLSASTDVVLEHLMKCYLMPNNSSKSHWYEEIVGQLKKVKSLKGGNSFPSAKQIYNWTYGKNRDLITNPKWFGKFVKDICQQYSVDLDIPISQIMDEFDEICYEYFTWLAEILSEFGFVLNSEVYEKLNSLLP